MSRLQGGERIESSINHALSYPFSMDTRWDRNTILPILRWLERTNRVRREEVAWKNEGKIGRNQGTAKCLHLERIVPRNITDVKKEIRWEHEAEPLVTEHLRGFTMLEIRTCLEKKVVDKEEKLNSKLIYRFKPNYSIRSSKELSTGCNYEPEIHPHKYSSGREPDVERANEARILWRRL